MFTRNYSPLEVLPLEIKGPLCNRWFVVGHDREEDQDVIMAIEQSRYKAKQAMDRMMRIEVRTATA
jgi:hypothetical protein